jgi:hypothetical protein
MIGPVDAIVIGAVQIPLFELRVGTWYSLLAFEFGPDAAVAVTKFS